LHRPATIRRSASTDQSGPNRRPILCPGRKPPGVGLPRGGTGIRRRRDRGVATRCAATRAGNGSSVPPDGIASTRP
jgi:hypothetical protein